jgi:hypothetical protein
MINCHHLFIFVYACTREKIISYGVVNDETQVKERRRKKGKISSIVLKNEFTVYLPYFPFLKKGQNDHLLFFFPLSLEKEKKNQTEKRKTRNL